MWKSRNQENVIMNLTSKSILPKTATGFGLVQTVPQGPSLFMQLQPIGFHGPRTKPEYNFRPNFIGGSADAIHPVQGLCCYSGAIGMTPFVVCSSI